jgi:hypothetical protein
MTLRLEDDNETLKLFKTLDAYGANIVVGSSSSWFESEHTIHGMIICIS